jgi:hypothetical protein
VKEFLRLLFAPCSEISLRASTAMDHDLPRSHRVAVSFHCLYCKACRRYRRQIRFMRAALWALVSDAPLARILPDVSLSPEARDRLRRSIREP